MEARLSSDAIIAFSEKFNQDAFSDAGRKVSSNVVCIWEYKWLIFLKAVLDRRAKCHVCLHLI